MNEPSGPSRAERKKVRRRERREAERATARELDALADRAVEEALRLAPEVAGAPNQAASERLVDVPVSTVDAARYVRKRINAALASDEWLDEVQVWVWEAGVHQRDPMSDAGRARGVELRLEQPGAHSG